MAHFFQTLFLHWHVLRTLTGIAALALTTVPAAMSDPTPTSSSPTQHLSARIQRKKQARSETKKTLKTVLRQLGMTDSQARALLMIFQKAHLLTQEHLAEAAKALHLNPNQIQEFGAAFAHPERAIPLTHSDPETIAAVLVYVTQYIVAPRAQGQERYEIASASLTPDLIKAAKTAGFLDQPFLKQKQYHFCLIPGSSYAGMLAAVATWRQKIAPVWPTCPTYILSGYRKAWAEIDGCLESTQQRLGQAISGQMVLDQAINPRVVCQELGDHLDEKKRQDGKILLQKVARFQGAPLASAPFVLLTDRKDAPKETDVKLLREQCDTSQDGLIPGRTYLNTTSPHHAVTETTLARYIVKTYLKPPYTLAVMDSPRPAGSARATTASTIAHFIKTILPSFQKVRDLKVVIVGHAPFLKRQAEQIRQALQDAVGQTRRVHVEGLSSPIVEQAQKAYNVFSEAAAYLFVCFQNAQKKKLFPGNISTEQLQYNQRPKQPSPHP